MELTLATPQPTVAAPPTARSRVFEAFQMPPGIDNRWIDESIELCRRNYLQPELRLIISTAHESGINGSYFIVNQEGRPVSVIKPYDEELGCECAITTGASHSKDGIKPGTSVQREFIAYRLFPDKITPTALAHISSGEFFHRDPSKPSKMCSLQRYISNTGNFRSVRDPTSPEIRLQLASIARIDLCLANADRTFKNIIVRDLGETQLIFPIDHGCILPNNCLSGGNFAWYPYLTSEDMFSTREQAIISAIDEKKYIRIATAFLIDPGAINTLTICLHLVKHLCGVAPIREIAMYYLDRAEDTGVFSRLLLQSMLRIAAYRQNPGVSLRASSKDLIDPELICATIHEVTDFIHMKKTYVEAFLNRHTEMTPEQKAEIKEGRKGVSERIHIAHRITRDLLTNNSTPNYEIIGNAINEALEMRIAEVMEPSS